MRPIRLEMEGFLAYRRATTVDFEGADLFVLSGPTGSGKSSVIDAMTFALYGSVPRLEDRKLIEPVINATADRARVMFEFSVGNDVWKVARSLERTKTGGARASEVRLEGPDATFDGRGVTDAVADLLGLTFEQFTKAVVLPQGAFADFITDTPKEKQDLLRALLDLGIFEDIKKEANQRAAAAASRAQTLEEALEKLDVPSQGEVGEAEKNVILLETALDQLPSRMEALVTARAAREAAQKSVDSHQGRLEALREVEPPEGLGTAELAVSEAQASLVAARKALSEHEASIAAARATLDSKPALADLRGWVEGLDSLRAKQESLERVGLAEREKAATERAAALAKARDALDDALASHAAHELRAGLAAGDVCPVCGHQVEAIPALDPGAEGAVEKARAAHAAAEGASLEAGAAFASAAGQAALIREDIERLQALARSAPPTARADLESVVAAEEHLKELIDGIDPLRLAVAAAEDAGERAAELANSMRESLLAYRDRLAGEKPPIPQGDAVTGWQAFMEWRDGRIEGLATELPDLEASRALAEVQLEEAEARFSGWLATLGINDTDKPEAEIALALGRARAAVAEMKTTISEAADRKKDFDEARSSARVAKELGKHLRADNFEAWVMEEAMEVLMTGANSLLADLAGGAYSLTAAAGQFEVIDHRNADQVRSVKSLSGGEVFLVSLSLALTMASQLAELTSSATRLESVFLDEGFGSLDQESLDVVASVLDELVGQGRTVGIVTHVKDLSERIPIRFEVTKGPDSASVERVVA